MRRSDFKKHIQYAKDRNILVLLELPMARRIGIDMQSRIKVDRNLPRKTHTSDKIICSI